MQNKPKKKPPVEEVKKPILTGSWHGRDAWALAGKRALSFLATAVIYLIAGMLMTFDGLWIRVVVCVIVVGAVAYYQYTHGILKGENDAAFGEIMYAHQAEGKTVDPIDRQRCFHPLKGVFATLVGFVPFLAVTLIFALLTTPSRYTLGVLPSWTQGFMEQTEFADALGYYTLNTGLDAMAILRIVVRAMIMPFINVAVAIGDDAALLAERLSPLLLLIAPMFYGLGYSRGLHLRARINTGIKMGDEKKKRRERKARKQRQRQRSKEPERLI